MSLLQRAPGVNVQDMDGDLFMVKPDSGEIWHLDRMAAAIWHALAEPCDRDDLLVLFSEAFPETPAATLAGDLDRALDELRAGGLII